jgi:hypothetical protein
MTFPAAGLVLLMEAGGRVFKADYAGMEIGRAGCIGHSQLTRLPR